MYQASAPTVALVGALVAGNPAMTGASTDITTYLYAHLRLSPQMAQEPVLPAADPALEAREMIAWLRDDGLPVSALADILQVERKSLYNWLDGGNIKPHNFERLSSVYHLLRDTRQAELRHLYRVFRRPLPDGRTLGELLQEGHLDEMAIHRALRQLWPVAKAYQEKEQRRPLPTGLAGNPLLGEVPEAITSNER